MTYEEWKKDVDKKHGDGTFAKMRKMHINEKRDREQYKKYIGILGKNNMPKIFDKFQLLKYNNLNEWTMLKNYAHSIKTGELSPLASFDLYKEISKEIDEKLVGTITSNGLEVTGKSIHFVARTIGYVEQRRNGVSVDDSLLTITQPKRIEPIRKNANGNGQKFMSKVAAVTVNPNSGILIQVNPLHVKVEEVSK